MLKSVFFVILRVSHSEISYYNFLLFQNPLRGHKKTQLMHVEVVLTFYNAGFTKL
jgi:hypothetical protein